jgi:hypothetical protein
MIAICTGVPAGTLVILGAPAAAPREQSPAISGVAGRREGVGGRVRGEPATRGLNILGHYKITITTNTVTTIVSVLAGEAERSATCIPLIDRAIDCEADAEDGRAVQRVPQLGGAPSATNQDRPVDASRPLAEAMQCQNCVWTVLRRSHALASATDRGIDSKGLRLRCIFSSVKPRLIPIGRS